MNEQEFIQRYLAGERDFSGADLEGISLDGSNPNLLEILPTVSLNEEDSNPRIILQDLNLAGANLKNIKFGYINLENVNLSESVFDSLDFHNSHFTNVDFTNVQVRDDSCWKKTSFVNCNFFQVQLQNISLSEVVFHNCNLERANIKFYELYNTNFESYNLRQFQLTGN